MFKEIQAKHLYKQDFIIKLIKSFKKKCLNSKLALHVLFLSV